MLVRNALLVVALTGCESFFPLEPLEPGCPDDYTQTETGCYRANTMRANWPAAEGDCQLDHGHLVVIGSSAELVSVFDLLSLEGEGRAFVGLYALDRKTYRWITPEVADPPPQGPPWADNEPTLNGVDDCGVLATSSGVLVGLISFDSTAVNDYVCEIDNFDPDPDRFPQ